MNKTFKSIILIAAAASLIACGGKKEDKSATTTKKEAEKVKVQTIQKERISKVLELSTSLEGNLNHSIIPLPVSNSHSIIHDVEEQQMMRTISFLPEAQPFQKFSRATIRSLFWLLRRD